MPPNNKSEVRLAATSTKPTGSAGRVDKGELSSGRKALKKTAKCVCRHISTLTYISTPCDGSHGSKMACMWPIPRVLDRVAPKNALTPLITWQNEADENAAEIHLTRIILTTLKYALLAVETSFDISGLPPKKWLRWFLPVNSSCLQHYLSIRVPQLQVDKPPQY